MKYFIIYLLFVNIVAVFVTCIDKNNAIKEKYRVPENLLFVVSIFGGSIFMYITMKLIRHKTKHKRFMIGLPIIIVAQVVFTIYIFKTFLLTI